jgi:hypothetical protein
VEIADAIVQVKSSHVCQVDKATDQLQRITGENQAFDFARLQAFHVYDYANDYSHGLHNVEKIVLILGKFTIVKQEVVHQIVKVGVDKTSKDKKY